MSILEQFQTEAALQDRLDKLAKSELRSRIGTLEHSAITDAIRHTGAALTRLQVELYGVDDPDEMESTVAANTSEWGWAAGLIVSEPKTMSEAELRALWGDR